MTLDPQIAALLGPPQPAFEMTDLPVHALRKYVRDSSTAFPPLAVPLAGVADRTIPGPAGALACRVYTPLGDRPFPVIVYFHGGGWVVGDLDTQDRICRALCHGANAVVLSVDYRLAPEHQFPAAVDDAYAATCWAAAHAGEIEGDSGRLVVAGDSAGGGPRVRERADPDGGRGRVLLAPVPEGSRGRSASPLGFADSRGEPSRPASGLRRERGARPHARRLRGPRGEARERGGRDGVPPLPGAPHGFASWFGLADVAQRAIDDACAFVASHASAGCRREGPRG